MAVILAGHGVMKNQRRALHFGNLLFVPKKFTVLFEVFDIAELGCHELCSLLFFVVIIVGRMSFANYSQAI